jgi:hypothetical protein
MGILILVLTFKIRKLENIPTAAKLLEGPCLTGLKKVVGQRTKLWSSMIWYVGDDDIFTS